MPIKCTFVALLLGLFRGLLGAGVASKGSKLEACNIRCMGSRGLAGPGVGAFRFQGVSWASGFRALFKKLQTNSHCVFFWQFRQGFPDIASGFKVICHTIIILQ